MTNTNGCDGWIAACDESMGLTHKHGMHEKRRGEGDNGLRFLLGTDGSKKPLLWVCMNPHTACAEGLDPTTKRIKAITSKTRYDGWELVNLYPQISGTPGKLPSHLDSKIVAENLDCIRQLVEALPTGTLAVAAWGNDDWITSKHKTRQLQLIIVSIDAIIHKHGMKWLRNAKGPKPSSTAPTPWHPLHAQGGLVDFDRDFAQYTNRVGIDTMTHSRLL